MSNEEKKARKAKKQERLAQRDALVVKAKETEQGKPDGEPAEHLTENQILYSKKEEWMNRITHCVGAGLSIVGAVALIIRTVLRGHTPLSIVAVCLYGFSLILMFTISTLYHWMPVGKRRRAVFRRFDHCSIPILIAGTYAPYMLIEVYAREPFWGVLLCAIVLTVAVLAIVFNAIDVNKFRVFGIIAYLVMGWACLMRIHVIFQNLPAFIMLLSGGVLYTAGVGLYGAKKLRYNHAIFHYFVIFGAVLHYFGIFFFIV